MRSITQLCTVLLSLFLLVLFSLNPILGKRLSFLGESDEVTSLPGLNFKIHFRHFSGYLSSVNQSSLHYWFFESQNEPSTDPVLLWLQGGPGCSSLLGALTEQGPILMSPNGTLALNAYSWNVKANVIFLESPAGVGFSYNANGDYSTNDDRTAALNFGALQSFFTKFPQYLKNDFYISGESYGGVYVPTLSQIAYNAKFPPQFKGFVIGNGYLDQPRLGNSVILFYYYHGLFDTTLWNSLVSACCADVTNVDQCNFVNNNQADCLNAVKQVSQAVGEANLNWYNIYTPCPSTLVTKINQNQKQRNALMPDQVAKRFVWKNLLKQKNLPTNDDVSCLNYDKISNWINTKSVRSALHINAHSSNWSPCSNINYTNQYTSLLDIVKGLLIGGQLKGLIYNGDVDTVCNYIGDKWFAEALGFATKVDYHPWNVENSNGDVPVGGWMKEYENNLVYTTIRGSGHMVPQDKPQAALQMLLKFINNDN